MTRILLVETASPKRVRRAAESLLAGGAYPDPQITIVRGGSRRDAASYRGLAGVRILLLRERGKLRILAALRRRRFDVVRVFWTGERYRRMKLWALGLGRRATLVDIGDGALIRLAARDLLRHALFRLAHPLPRDHWELVPQARASDAGLLHDGERILVIESADPTVVGRGLDRLGSKPIFRSAHYTVFCRNRPEAVRRFRSHPLVSDVRPHSEARRWTAHLRALRRERFDGIVLFFTGDPSYWKIKYFAFLLGARHKLIFNENGDCFFFSWSAWLGLLVRRLRERARPGAGSRGTPQLRSALLLLIKLALLPFRFTWLLVVWLRLRGAASGRRPGEFVSE